MVIVWIDMVTPFLITCYAMNRSAMSIQTVMVIVTTVSNIKPELLILPLQRYTLVTLGYSLATGSALLVLHAWFLTVSKDVE